MNLVFFFVSIWSTFFTFIQERKQKQKKLFKKIHTKAMKYNAERA